MNIENRTHEKNRQLEILQKKYKCIKKQIDDKFLLFNNNKRKREQKLCTGNSRKAIKQFWSHIKKEKSSTIENIKELNNPNTNILTTKKEEIMEITEAHLIKHFNASYSRQPQTEYEEHIEHNYKRHLDEDENQERHKRLKSTDFT